MGMRQREWARRKRKELIYQLGGCCVLCGVTEDLEFDHIVARRWEPNNREWSWRISTYAKEAREGKIQILCKECNAKKGKPPDLPLTREEVEEVESLLS